METQLESPYDEKKTTATLFDTGQPLGCTTAPEIDFHRRQVNAEDYSGKFMRRRREWKRGSERGAAGTI